MRWASQKQEREGETETGRERQSETARASRDKEAQSETARASGDEEAGDSLSGCPHLWCWRQVPTAPRRNERRPSSPDGCAALLAPSNGLMNVLTIGKHVLGRYRPQWQAFLAGGKCDFYSFCLSPAPVLYRLSVPLSSEASSSLSTSCFSPSGLTSDVQSCNQGKTHVDSAVAASSTPGAPGGGVETGATRGSQSPGVTVRNGHSQSWGHGCGWTLGAGEAAITRRAGGGPPRGQGTGSGHRLWTPTWEGVGPGVPGASTPPRGGPSPVGS